MSRKIKWKEQEFRTYKVKLPAKLADRFNMFLKAKSGNQKKTKQDFFEQSVIDALDK